MIIRLLLLLCIALLVVAAVMYFITQNPRYLDFAWKTVRAAGMVGVVLVLLLLLERYALVGWGVLRF